MLVRPSPIVIALSPSLLLCQRCLRSCTRLGHAANQSLVILRRRPRLRDSRCSQQFIRCAQLAPHHQLVRGELRACVSGAVVGVGCAWQPPVPVVLCFRHIQGHHVFPGSMKPLHQPQQSRSVGHRRHLSRLQKIHQLFDHTPIQFGRSIHDQLPHRPIHHDQLAHYELRDVRGCVRRHGRRDHIP
ncbi:hypothetical protein PF002_g27236 [Phytophthora fragariae]|uniref:Uncharacterized protein n=1 Tax=Phytophthora fragariae TaxID=53985 RepID=A0A6A3WEW6_9STRA|nr:hypothetical protein PF002_g27236 [Phytophthora fragariae]